MFDVEKIAERRIVEAMEHGEFDNLPGAGRPLNLDDDAGIPESLRMAYRVMKNAGVLPPEIDLRRASLHPATRRRRLDPGKCPDRLLSRGDRRRLVVRAGPRGSRDD